MNPVIHEVGMRDGLQMEEIAVPTEIKIKWIDKLIDSGLKYIQLGSFVHPVKVPQMNGTDQLFNHFKSLGLADTVFSGLVLNEKGFERGLECGVDMFCMGVSASETHSMKNTGMSIQEAQIRIIKMAKEAVDAGKVVQCSVQSAFGCGFEGVIPEEKVLGIINNYIESGINMISLADTVGMAKPDSVESMLSKIRAEHPDVVIACHFHDTMGYGMANAKIALDYDVKYFESAFGGLGGCPFTKSPVGNIPTESLIELFEKNKIETNITKSKIIELVYDSKKYFGKDIIN